MSDSRKGVLAMIGACLIWGLSPMYYKMLSAVPPLEVLAHRTLWSLALFGALLLVQRRLGELGLLLGGWQKAGAVAFAALMISCNWFVFIWAIQAGRAVEASLGYYLFPLVAVLLGRLLFSERLGSAQWLAVAMAGAAIVLLTLGLGVLPWIALILAFSFGLYGVAKKRSGAGPVVTVTGEVLLLAPLAAAWLWGVHAQDWQGIGGHGGGAVFGHDRQLSVLLALSGPMTAVPLILFSYATRRVRLATIGLIQYLNPTLQFLVAVLVFSEPFTGMHLAAFALIWLALGIYSFQALRAEHSLRRAAVRVETSGTL